MFYNCRYGLENVVIFFCDDYFGFIFYFFIDKKVCFYFFSMLYNKVLELEWLNIYLMFYSMILSIEN